MEKEFIYTVVINGKEVTKKTRAENIDKVKEMLDKKGYIIVDIVDAPPNGTVKLNEKEILFFTANLSSLLKSGFNIIDALEIMKQKDTSNKVKRAVNSLLFYIQKGHSLSNAMKNSRSFPSMVVSLVTSGEKSGNLIVSLKDIADYYNISIRFKNKITNAMFYPLITILFAFISVFVYLLFALPSITEIYKYANFELPSFTVKVIKVSQILNSYWYIIIPAIFLLGFSINKIVTKVKPVRMFYEKIILALPIIKDIKIMPEYIKLAKVLKNSYTSGLPIPIGLSLVVESISLLTFKEKVKRAVMTITRGMPINEAFEKEGMDEFLVKSVSLGEKSGTLEDALNQYIDVTEQEFYDYLNKVVALIEPLSLVVVGALIGLIVVSLYLPVFNLANALLSQ